MPASSSAMRIARAGLSPVGSGSVDVRRVGRTSRSRAARRRSSRRAPSRARAPRARATPAASPITSPSRAASNGREARVGSSLRRERARIASKPAMPTRVIGASLPPANIASARPEPDRVERVADRHVRGGARGALGSSAGPCVPSSIETQPAPMFGMIDGIENGLTRSGPRVSEHVVAVLERVRGRRCPVAIEAPTRSRLARRCRSRSPARPGAPRRGPSARSGPSAAPTCGRPSRSGRSPSARRRSAPGSPSWSKCVISAAPDSPASRRCHVVVDVVAERRDHAEAR